MRRAGYCCALIGVLYEPWRLFGSASTFSAYLVSGCRHAYTTTMFCIDQSPCPQCYPIECLLRILILDCRSDALWLLCRSKRKIQDCRSLFVGSWWMVVGPWNVNLLYFFFAVYWFSSSFRIFASYSYYTRGFNWRAFAAYICGICEFSFPRLTARSVFLHVTEIRSFS